MSQGNGAGGIGAGLSQGQKLECYPCKKGKLQKYAQWTSTSLKPVMRGLAYFFWESVVFCFVNEQITVFKSIVKLVFDKDT